MAKVDNLPKVNLSHEGKTIGINNLIINNTLVYEYFKSIPAEKYLETIQKAIHIGALALMEDRFSAFLANTKNELGVQLESLKLIYDMKIKEYTQTTQKGVVAEIMVFNALLEYITANEFNDGLESTGSTKGTNGKNKTGDLVITLNEINKKIAIEVKLDSSVTLGDFKTKADKFASNIKDTAISQILESKFNRDGDFGIFVYDSSSVNIAVSTALTNGIKYFPGVGFVVIVDILSNDYRNLFLAYLLSRDMAYNNNLVQINTEWVNVFLDNMMNDFKNIISLKSDVDGIKKGLDSTIKACDKLTDNINKNIVRLESNYNYFNTFIKNNDRNSGEFFKYFSGKNYKDSLSKLE